MFEGIPWQAIVKLGQRSLIHRPLFAVAWTLTRYCNYSCSYCWPHAHTTDKEFRPFWELKKTIDEIKRQADERGLNCFHFSFSGGEPTLHPELLRVIRYLTENMAAFQSVHVTSNMSRGMRWWNEFVASAASLHVVGVTASWHPEAGINSPKNHRERFIEKVSFLRSKGVRGTINIVMAPERFDQLLADADVFRAAKLNTTLKPLRNANGSAPYTREQQETLEDNLPTGNGQDSASGCYLPARPSSHYQLPPIAGSAARAHMDVELEDRDGNKWYLDEAERLNVLGFNQFEGWICEAGFRSIIISEPSGEIRRGFGCYDKGLGTISGGFSLLPAPRRCVTPSCLCSADSKIPKWRSREPTAT